MGTIGTRIRERRELLHYSRKQLANKIGMSEIFACEIELGKKTPSVNTLMKICEVLSVSADYILWGKVSDKSEKDSSPIVEMMACLNDNELKHFAEMLRAYVKAISDAKTGTSYI